MKYQVKFYTGDYSARQANANKDKAICYVEHHFNASASPLSNYAVAIVGSNASQRSKDWGKRYTDLVSQKFCIKGWKDGVMVGGYGGRGDGNIVHTKMPAILLEPMFISNPEMASLIVMQETRFKLADILARTIQEFFPDGGIVAFSVGHKYKTSSPKDRGAAVAVPDPDPSDSLGHSEADYAEDVLMKAKKILEEIQ